VSFLVLFHEAERPSRLQRHLGKHRRDVERFFRAVARQSYRSEVTQGYDKRLLKYQDKLLPTLPSLI
jgi:hypothetical protein